MAVIWFLRYGVQWTEFFVILDHFLPFYPPNNLKNQNFKKMKKMPGDIILHKCTKNHDHMLFCSWDMACDTCNCYFSFWTNFCPFTAQQSKKNQNFEKIKKTSGDIIILHMCTKKYDHMMYSSWDMMCNRQTDGQTDRWTEGQTDRWKKWHIEVGAQPKK